MKRIRKLPLTDAIFDVAGYTVTGPANADMLAIGYDLWKREFHQTMVPANFYVWAALDTTQPSAQYVFYAFRDEVDIPDAQWTVIKHIGTITFGKKTGHLFYRVI